MSYENACKSSQLLFHTILQFVPLNETFILVSFPHNILFRFYNSLPNPDVILCLRKSKTLLDDPTNNIPNTAKQESISQIEETGREVVAHRAVLMARSEYLRNILQDNKWSQEERINIEEVKTFNSRDCFLDGLFQVFGRLSGYFCMTIAPSSPHTPKSHLVKLLRFLRDLFLYVTLQEEVALMHLFVEYLYTGEMYVQNYIIYYSFNKF